MSEQKIAVNISKSLHDEIELRVKHSNGAFKNVEEYIEFVLDEFVKQDSAIITEKEKHSENEEIKKKLKSLGYM